MSSAPLVTHVPDRAPSLAPGLLEGLRSAHPDHILHTGDVCSSRVLAELGELAPVSVAQGNRDLLFVPPLPMAVELEFAGVKVGLVHGHGGWKRYWLDKFAYITEGYRVERYQKTVLVSVPQAVVLVYGHSHRPENRWIDGRLIFNPGAAVGFRLGKFDFPPSYGVLRFYAEGRVEGEILSLPGTELRRGAWVRRESS